MACCIVTAYVMNRFIKACEILNLDILKIQYNEFDDGPIYDEKARSEHGTLVVSKFSIDGMTCAACVSAIEGAARPLKGVDSVSVSLTLSRASVAHYRSIISEDRIADAIEARGYHVKSGGRTAEQNSDLARHVQDLAQQRQAFGRALAMASAISSIDWVQTTVHPASYARTVLSSAIVVGGLWVQLVKAELIHNRAWQKSPLKAPTMDTLISLSLLLGLILSASQTLLFGLSADPVYWSSGSLLTVVILGGRYIDTLLRRQTANSLAQLYGLQNEALLVKACRYAATRSEATSRDDQSSSTALTTVTSALSLRPGDEVILDPGTIIPCDCYVTRGTSHVDEATMTGESLPAIRTVGDFLISGTRNLSAQLTATVSKVQEESALEQLISSVSAATETQPEDTGPALLSSSFVRLIVLIAIGSAFASFMMCDEALPLAAKIITAGERAMAILASACPCALGLATPSAVMSGMSVAWTRGIIVRGGVKTMEKLTRLTHVVMDKTGTLTTGQLSVTQSAGAVKALHCMLICATERDDARTHPVARALFQWALRCLTDEQRQQQQSLHVNNYHSEMGKGVSCTVEIGLDHFFVHIGTAQWLAGHDIELPLTDQASTHRGITIYMAVNNKYTTTLHLQDTIRPEASRTAAALQIHLSLDPVLLTGDGSAEAQRVAAALGIPILDSRALPHQKLSHIQTLQSTPQKHSIAMIGDGLNDAPALAAADVGILLAPGLSRSSSTQAQVADVILTTHDLRRLVDAIMIARATVAQIRWNTRWALAYNVLAVLTAAGAFEWCNVKLDATRAGFMMVCSSISVVGWSLWFRRGLENVRFENLGDQGNADPKNRSWW